ncbi:hypothetical protein HC761_00030 [bacterium]|nr:hypothetical protein [bacterium]
MSGVKILVCQINFVDGGVSYYATNIYATASGDSPPNVNCEARLGRVEIERVASVSLWQQRQTARPAISQLTLENRDGALNAWKARSIKDQTIRLWVGYKHQPLSTFSQVATLTGDGMDVTDRVTIRLLPLLGALDKQASETYAASGISGPGRRMIALGALRYAPTEMINYLGLDFFSNREEYQFSWADGDLETNPSNVLRAQTCVITAVLSSPQFGFAVGFPGAGSPSAECVAEQLIGTEIPGINPRSTRKIRELIIEVCRRAGIAESKLDAANLAALVTQLPHDCGIFAKDETCAEVLSIILASCAGGYYETPAGGLKFWWPGSSLTSPVAAIECTIAQ